MRPIRKYRKRVTKEFTAATYATGGVEFTVGELEKIVTASVVANPSQILEANDTAYSISWTVTDNKVKVVIKTINVTAASPVAWTELAAGTDISSVRFIVDAVGY